MESAGPSLNVGLQRASDRRYYTFSQAVSPTEDKYRRLRFCNARIEATLAAAPNALPALQALGWQADPEATDFLVCPKSVRPSMAEVTYCHQVMAVAIFQQLCKHALCKLARSAVVQALVDAQGLSHRSVCESSSAVLYMLLLRPLSFRAGPLDRGGEG